MYAGYMFTYYNSKVTEERKARIERINEQVFALCFASSCGSNNLLC